MKYRIENNIEIYSDKNLMDILILKRGTGEIYEIEVDDAGLSLLSKFKKNEFLNKEEIQNNELDSFNFLLEHKIITSSETYSNLDNRSALQAYNDMGLDPEVTLKKIQSKKIAIIGVGGTGSWIAMQLLGLGFKNLVLVDPDLVESSNLSRQYFFKHQVGAAKVNALKQTLRNQYSDVNIEVYKQMIQNDEDLKKTCKASDIVMIAADIPNRDGAATLIGNWCLKYNKPHIVCGGYSGHGSSLGMTIIPKVTPCWNCYKESIKDKIPKLATDENLFLKGHVNTSGLITSVQVGASFSAMEAFNLAVGIAPSLSGKYSDLMILEAEIQKTEVKKDKNCKWCNS